MNAIISMVVDLPPPGRSCKFAGEKPAPRPISFGENNPPRFTVLSKDPSEVTVIGISTRDPCTKMTWLTGEVMLKSLNSSVITKTGVLTGCWGDPPLDIPVIVIGYEPAGVSALVWMSSSEGNVGSPLGTVNEAVARGGRPV